MSTMNKPYDLFRAVESVRSVIKATSSIPNSVTAKEFEKTGVGIIKLPYRVLSLRGLEQLKESLGKKRIISVDPKKLDLTKFHTVDSILVPWMSGFGISSDMICMNQVISCANEILQTIENADKLEESSAQLQKAVWGYMKTVAKVLGGKRGLIRREIFETRLGRSMRGVAVPEKNLSFYQVGIGRNKTGLIEGLDTQVVYCLLDREPNLWMGSVQVMELVVLPYESDAIYTNPFCYRELNLDFDGDCVSIVVPPHTEKTIPELSAACGYTQYEYARWSEEFLLCNPDPKVDWSRPVEDLNSRVGKRFTLTPREIVSGSGEYLEACKSNKAKSVPDDFASFARGVNLDQFVNEAQNAVLQLIRMKREIGILGALTDKIVQLTLGLEPKRLKDSLRIKEFLVQLLLDSKSGTHAFDSHKLSDLFGKKGKYQSLTKTDFIEELKKLSIPDKILELFGKVLDVIWDYLPLDDTLEAYASSYCMTRKNDPADVLKAGKDRLNCITKIVEGYILESFNSKENQDEMADGEGRSQLLSGDWGRSEVAADEELESEYAFDCQDDEE